MRFPLQIEDLNFRGWRAFYQASFVAISITSVAVLAIPNKDLALLVLIATQIGYLPFVINEFRKAMKKKIK